MEGGALGGRGDDGGGHGDVRWRCARAAACSGRVRCVIQPTPAPVPSGAARGAKAKGTILAVSCPAPGTCIAVGSYGKSTGSTSAVAERYSGDTWTDFPVPAPPEAGTGSTGSAALTAISCWAPDGCVAVGNYPDTSGSSTTYGLIDELTSAGWSTLQAPEVQGPEPGQPIGDTAVGRVPGSVSVLQHRHLPDSEQKRSAGDAGRGCPEALPGAGAGNSPHGHSSSNLPPVCLLHLSVGVLGSRLLPLDEQVHYTKLPRAHRHPPGNGVDRHEGPFTNRSRDTGHIHIGIDRLPRYPVVYHRGRVLICEWEEHRPGRGALGRWLLTAGSSPSQRRSSDPWGASP